QRAVGGVDDLDRAKPVVGGAEEFGTGFRRSTIAFECRSPGSEGDSTDAVMNRLTKQSVAVEVFAKPRVAHDGGPAAGGHAVGAVEVVEPINGAARWENRGGGRAQEDKRRRRRDERIAQQVLVIERKVEQRKAVVVAEPLAVVISRAAKLRAAADSLHFS